MGRPYGYHYLDEEKKKLAEENVNLIWFFIGKQTKKGKLESHELDDLSGHLMMHYCFACESYDPTRNIKFSTYAFKALSSAIIAYRTYNKKFYDRFITFDYSGIGEDSTFTEPVVKNEVHREIDFEKIEDLFINAELNSFEHIVFYYKHNLSHNYVDISEIMGYSRERIRQFYDSGLNKLIKYVKKSGYSVEYFLK